MLFPLTSFFKENVRYILTLDKANQFFASLVLLISFLPAGVAVQRLWLIRCHPSLNVSYRDWLFKIGEFAVSAKTRHRKIIGE
jgi:hypothetical protein